MSHSNDNSQHINGDDTSPPEMRAKGNNPSGVDAFVALALSTSRNENLTMLPSEGIVRISQWQRMSDRKQSIQAKPGCRRHLICLLRTSVRHRHAEPASIPQVQTAAA